MPPLPRTSRRLLGFCLLAVCAVGGFTRAEAKTRKLTLPQHDLELEVPESWQPGPASDYAAAVLHNPPKKGETLGSRTAVLLVTPIAREVHIDKAEFVASTRRLIEEKKGLIVGRGLRTLGPLTFVTSTISENLSQHPRTLMCTTFGNDRAVTLMLSSQEGDPANDPELDAILQSLHFLSPFHPVPELTIWDRTMHIARRHIPLLATMGLLAGAAIAALVVLLKRRRAPAAGRRRSPAR